MMLISTAAIILPAVLIVSLGLIKYRTFSVFAIYCLLSSSYNLLSGGYFNLDANMLHFIGMFINLLDAPLMLYFLTYFTDDTGIRKRMKWIVLSLLVCEAIFILAFGFNMLSVTILMGAGLLAVLYFVFNFFIRQIKFVIIQGREVGKAMIISAILIAYYFYTSIYFTFYVLKIYIIQNRDDLYFTYYLGCIFSYLLLSVGIFIEKKRIHKLTEINTVNQS